MPMLARVADNLYWYSRYLRRAENTARLIGVVSHLQLDLPAHMRFTWAPLLDILDARARYDELYAQVEETDVVRFLLFDERNDGSLLRSLETARSVLRNIRDTLPQESWEKTSALHAKVLESVDAGVGRRQRSELLARVIDGCQSASSELNTSMSRDLAFQFLRLGFAFEQADMTTRIIDAGSAGLVQVHSAEDLAPFQNIQWLGVLRSLGAYHMYRRHVRQRVNAKLALGFLLQDRNFPRSVLFCLSRVQHALGLLPGNASANRAASQALALVTDADPHVLDDAAAQTLMDEIQQRLGTLHNALGAAYFPH